tara:strand:+ start:183 stop:389 length:207 start_codon:yes stop_codon:yes gene_type:complete
MRFSSDPRKPDPSSENIEDVWLQLADWTVINIAQLCMKPRALTTSWLKEKIKAAKGGARQRREQVSIA